MTFMMFKAPVLYCDSSLAPRVTYKLIVNSWYNIGSMVSNLLYRKFLKARGKQERERELNGVSPTEYSLFYVHVHVVKEESTGACYKMTSYLHFMSMILSISNVLS